MIFADLIGLALQFFACIDQVVLPAVVVGMFVAMLVPARSACSVPTRTPRE